MDSLVRGPRRSERSLTLSHVYAHVVATRRSDAAWQVATPGVALIIAGPVFAFRFHQNPGSVALGVAAGVFGVALLISVFLRYFRQRS